MKFYAILSIMTVLVLSALSLSGCEPKKQSILCPPLNEPLLIKLRQESINRKTAALEKKLRGHSEGTDDAAGKAALTKTELKTLQKLADEQRKLMAFTANLFNKMYRNCIERGQRPKAALILKQGEKILQLMKLISERLENRDTGESTQDLQKQLAEEIKKMNS